MTRGLLAALSTAKLEEMRIYTDELRFKLREKLRRNPDTSPDSFIQFVCSPDFIRARNRIEKWLDEFPDIINNQDVMNRFTLKDAYRHVIAELVVGIAGKRTGFQAIYSPNYDGKTPDWEFSLEGKRQFILEVTTLNPSVIRKAVERKIRAFAKSIRRLPFGVSLIMDCSDEEARIRFSQSKQTEYIEFIGNWLRREPPAGSALGVEGFLLEIESWNSGETKPRMKLNGLSYHSDPTLLETAILEKIGRYREISDTLQCSLWIALEVLEGVGVTREILDEVLSGRRRTLSRKESSQGAENVRKLLSSNRKGIFEKHRCLGGIIWVESNLAQNEWILVPIANPFATQKLLAKAVKETRFLNRIPVLSNADRLIDHEGNTMRYFLAFWVGDFPATRNQPAGTIYGERAYMSKTFLGRDELIADVKIIHPNLSKVTIWNFVELGQEDYLIWISKDRRKVEPRYESELLVVYD